MTKRKSHKKGGKHSDTIALITYAVIALIVLIVAVGAGYYYGYGDGKSDAQRKYATERKATEELVERLRKAAVAPTTTRQLQSVLQRDRGKYGETAQHEYGDTPKALPPVGPKRTPKLSTELPKLAIIIDDVAFAGDVRRIKALQMPLTMSFLPPSTRHPNSAKLAAKEPSYMVHLPLEAKNFSAAEPFTLRVNDSQREIINRIGKIKELFPKVRYINNHTGSTFTSNEIAMNRLIFALREEKINFIDSRTTAQTKAPDVMRNYGFPYVARDVFLDHDPDIASVKKQIKRAVAIAKKHGTAIAIGHPHKETLEALGQSRELLKDVQLVRVEDL